MRLPTLLVSIAVVMALAFCAGPVEEPAAAEMTAASALTPKEELGKKLFFDARLSEPAGQACAFCHGPEVGFTGPDPVVNAAHGVYPGALAPRFGNVKPPSAAYAGWSPKLHIDEEGTFVGGLFWNGRATGWDLGDPLAEQAMGPFLNPLEQNLSDQAGAIKIVLESEYAGLFREVWGPDSLSLDDIEGAYERVARSIAAFERTAEVNPFSSRFDDFWRKTLEAGLDVEEVDEDNWERFKGMGLEDDEVEGLMLFVTKGKCAECHVLTPVDGTPPSSPTSPTTISEHPAIPIIRSMSRTSSSTRTATHGWTMAWAGSWKASLNTSSTPPKTWGNKKSPRCATGTSGRLRTLPRLSCTTGS